MNEGFFRKNWPALAALALYWTVVAALVFDSVSHNDGHFVYPLDDAYIHMAMAKNIVHHHVWGVTKHSFSSSSSSPLWTLLLSAAYFVFGVSESLPLLLNLIFGTLTIALSCVFLSDCIPNRLLTFAVLALAVVVAPLPTLTLVGMEHTLQIFVIVAFAGISIRTLFEHEEGTGSGADHRILLGMLAAFATAVRYEDAFVVLIACALFAARGRYRAAVAIGLAALLPIVVYGIWSMSNGWLFLPNSVLLKAEKPHLSAAGILQLFAFGLVKLYAGHLLGLLFASALLAAIFHKMGDAGASIKHSNIALAAAISLHVLFGSAGVFFRYEAYLLWIGILVVSVSIVDLMRTPVLRKAAFATGFDTAVMVCVVGGTVIEFAQRTDLWLRMTTQATTNIYEQQYQMSRFLRAFYDGGRIAINDIGAIAYFADVNLLDLWGLASLDTARTRLHEQMTTESIDDHADRAGARIAVVYDSWFEQFGGLPPRWVKVGRWWIQNNVVCGSDVVSFYAVDPSAASELKRNLLKFSTELPPGVRQTIE